MFNKGVVDIATTEIALVSGALDSKLTLREGNDGDGEIGVTGVDEDNMTRSLGLREVGFSDSVSKSSRSVSLMRRRTFIFAIAAASMIARR